MGLSTPQQLTSVLIRQCPLGQTSSLNPLPAEIDVFGHGLVAVPIEVGVSHAHVAPLYARWVARLPIDGLNNWKKDLC